MDLEKISKTKRYDRHHLDMIESDDGEYVMYEDYLSQLLSIDKDLKLNASMLAKQCDLAREAEQERERLSKLLIDARVMIVRLREAIEKHKIAILASDYICEGTIAQRADEELYKALEE